MTYGTVIIRGTNDYVVFADPYERSLGYQVVSKEVDPKNAYDIDDVKAYCTAHPEHVLHDYQERQLSPAQYRKKLYATMRYKLIGDVSAGLPDLSRPFFEHMTVDEMSAKAVQYLGDNQDIVVACFAGKAEAKTYIRSLF